MSWIAPNLARHPFENLRPLRRISLALAIGAVLLSAWNVGTWLRTGAGAAEKATELERLTGETEKARAEIATLESDLLAADLEERNQQIEFLNEQIASRTFSWNLLFDHLVEILPPGVRLRRVMPKISRSGRRDRGRTSRPAGQEVVSLALSFEAESHEVYLEFIDRLLADSRFDQTDPSGATTREDGLVQSDLSVLYLPGAASEAAP